jgi:hypothetical protein
MVLDLSEPVVDALLDDASDSDYWINDHVQFVEMVNLLDNHFHYNCPDSK